MTMVPAPIDPAELAQVLGLGTDEAARRETAHLCAMLDVIDEARRRCGLGDASDDHDAMIATLADLLVQARAR